MSNHKPAKPLIHWDDYQPATPTESADMTTNHKPATALPWTQSIGSTEVYPKNSKGSPLNVAKCIETRDAAYIAHAANMYGPLVEALQAIDPKHPVLVKAGEA